MDRDGMEGEGEFFTLLLSLGDTEVEAEMVPPPSGWVPVGGAMVPDMDSEGEWE